ncbi:hypothetical protein L0128_01110 [candidate division KSB1 bacterium]|nr:hypothetical protein [candidate division KSB1 bacterium]
MGSGASISRTFQSLILMVIGLGLWSGRVGAQNNVHFDKMFFATYRIENPAMIDTLLNELLLPREGVNCIEFIDINENGPDMYDVLRLTSSAKSASKTSTPSAGQTGTYQVYSLADIGVPDNLRRRITSWKMTASQPTDDTFGSIDDAKRFHEKQKSAKSSIILTLLTGLLRNYDKSDVKLMLQRLPNGQFQFQMVGFDESSATYSAPWDPDSEMAETLVDQISGNEIMRAFFESLKSQFQSELVIMYRERVDTVYITESGKTKRAKGR